MKCELLPFFESHRSLTYNVDQLYKYMKNHKLLDFKSEEMFRFILMESKGDLRKNLSHLKRIIRLAQKNRKCNCSDFDWVLPEKEPGLDNDCIQPE